MIEPIVLADYPTNSWFKEQRALGKAEVFFTLRVPDIKANIAGLILTSSTELSYCYQFVNVIFDGQSNANFEINNQYMIDKAGWTDIMIAEYTDYLEWFLFNPEWML